MQTIVSELAFTFVDDAVALVTGFTGIVRDMAVETFTAARKRILAPVDRLARACDVGGVIAAREAAITAFALSARKLATHGGATPLARSPQRLPRPARPDVTAQDGSR